MCFIPAFFGRKNRKLFQSDSDLRYDLWTGPNPVSQLRFVHMPCVFEFMGYLTPPPPPETDVQEGHIANTDIAPVFWAEHRLFMCFWLLVFKDNNNIIYRYVVNSPSSGNPTFCP